MSDERPAAVPLAFWQQLRPTLLARVGEEKLAAIEAVMRDPRRFLAEPQTFQAMLAELGPAFTGNPVTLGEAIRLVSGLASVPGAFPPAKPDTLAQAAVRDIRTHAEAVAGPAAVANVLAPLRDPDVGARMFPSASDAVVTPEFGFERHTALVVRMVARSAETAYKPMLRASLQLTWLGRGETKSAANELGRIVGQCRDAWDEQVQALLLNQRAVVVRNSEMHGHTLFDSKTETVTFVNEKPDGTRTTLPMGRADFAPFVGDFMRLCAEMFQVLAFG